MQLLREKRSSTSRGADVRGAQVPRDARWVGVRYDASARHGHVESYFVKANDRSGERAVWLKWTIFAPERAPDRAVAEVWAVAFHRTHGHVATKATVPFESARFARDALAIDVDGCTLSPTGARGHVESGARAIAYDLSFDARGVAPIVPFPSARMYEGPFPSSKLVSPMPDMRASGSVVVDGVSWTLDAWPAMLGHNWGRRNAELYGWGHCNAWDRVDGVGADDLVLEGTTARVKLPGGLRTPMTTILCVRHRGVRYDMNSIASIARNRGVVTPRRWQFRGTCAHATIDGELWGTTDDFVGLYYANPDSPTTHCLNTKIAHARVELRVRGRPPATFTSKCAALEIGTHDASHGVRMAV
jgi:hypothetical protein